MGQGSDYYEEEEEIVGALTTKEQARMIEYLRAIGLTDKQINDCQIYIASGVGLPIKESDSLKK